MALSDATVVGLVDAILKVLGGDDDDDLQKRCVPMVQVVNRQVFAYVRGQGYDATGLPNPDLETVVITATARWASNPAMSDSESSTAPVMRMVAGAAVPLPGPDGVVATMSTSWSAFQGFSELEKAILHQYRVRNG